VTGTDDPSKAIDPSKAMLGPVPLGTLALEYYQSVCRAVTHEEPYVPKK
jgi:hypothetical protein